MIEAQPDSVFDPEWLALRELPDHGARAHPLDTLASAWLAPRARPLRLLDLGTGSGSNIRYLAPRLPGPQHWLAVDHDARLLAGLEQSAERLQDRDGQSVAVDTRVQDLSQSLVSGFHGFDLVSASALIDLVGEDWLQYFALACGEAQCAALISLSVDGSWTIGRVEQRRDNLETWCPVPHHDDDALREAFNAHQRRDKGCGGALGPDATGVAAALLHSEGFEVTVAPSPWRLHMDDPSHRHLAKRLMEGWVQAACDQIPSQSSRWQSWQHARAPLLDNPGTVITVGHVDLYAQPARPS